jgi:hypothetical protein
MVEKDVLPVVLPAREVAATIGPIAEEATRLLDPGLLDEALARRDRGEARAAGTAPIQRRLWC